MTVNKDNRVSVRLDDEAAANLQALVEQFDWTKSQVINELLKQCDKVWIIDGKKIAMGLQDMRVLLKKGIHNNQIEKDICRVCTELEKELYRVFTKGESDGSV